MAHKSGDREKYGLEGSERINRNLIDKDRRIVVASNRGPLGFFEDDSGRAAARRDSSPVSGLFESLEHTPLTWVSGAVSATDRRAADELTNEDGAINHDLLPPKWRQILISTPRRVHHKFFNVICNPLLWFLFHRSWSPTFTPNIGSQEHDAWERGFRALNESFAKRIDSSGSDQQLVLLCRDYQLMLVPGLVRAKNRNALIHYSVDTPWPWPNDLRIIPEKWRREILASLLSADVVTLSSPADISTFEASVTEVFNGEPTIENSGRGLKIHSNGHVTTVDVSTPLLRANQLDPVVSNSSTSRFITQLESTANEHTFVTVDRAEPHKNVVRSIVAFGELLKKRPELVGKVRYLLFLTPGPSHVSAYKRLNEEIRRSARRVNDSARGENPVQVYMENNFYRAIAGLVVYDTLVSVPVIDGAARSVLDGSVINQKDGNLIVSDTSPICRALSESAYTVSYTDVEGISHAMSSAYDEPVESRQATFDAVAKLLEASSKENDVESALERLLSI